MDTSVLVTCNTYVLQILSHLNEHIEQLELVDSW